MKSWKNFLLRLLRPHSIFLFALIPLCAILLTFSFLRFSSESPFSIVSYAVSFYTLVVLCFKIPSWIRFWKRVKEQNQYVKQWTNDPALRIKISLYLSLTMNTAYALLQLGLGLWHRSFWFYSLAIYYFLLVLVRFFLVRDVRGLTSEKDLVSEYKRYRFCGIILLIMNLALISIVFYVAYLDKGATHNDITTITLAAYTFGSFTIAIVNTVKYRRYHSPLYSAAKVINLAASSVSLLTLESAMFSAFGGETTAQTRHTMTLWTGIGICFFIMAIAIYMIVHATNHLKKIHPTERKEP